MKTKWVAVALAFLLGAALGFVRAGQEMPTNAPARRVPSFPLVLKLNTNFATAGSWQGTNRTAASNTVARTILPDKGTVVAPGGSQTAPPDSAIGTNILVPCLRDDDPDAELRAAAVGGQTNSVGNMTGSRDSGSGQPGRLPTWEETTPVDSGSHITNTSGGRQAVLPPNSVPADTPENIALFRAEAEKGKPEAQFALGNVFDRRIGESNKAEAACWYRKAAEQGHTEAQFALGIACLLGSGVQSNSEEAVSWFRKAAENGNVRAQLFLAGMYQVGSGVESNWVEYAKWIRKAAENGSAEAADCLGRAYRYGLGVESNITKAVEWFEKSAKQGYAQGWMSLAEASALGLLGPAGDREAEKWYQQALATARASSTNASDVGAATGEIQGRCALIGCKLLSEAPEAAITDRIARWLRRGAASELGLFQLRDWERGFRNGGMEFCKRDNAKAFVLLQFLAEKGDPSDQGLLALAYANGMGIKSNLIEAAKWHEKAAKQGNWESCMALAEINALGLLGRADDAEAERWFERALEAAKGKTQDKGSTTNTTTTPRHANRFPVGEPAINAVRFSCGAVGIKLLNRAPQPIPTDSAFRWLRRLAKMDGGTPLLRSSVEAFRDGGEAFGEQCVKNPRKAFVVLQICAERGRVYDQVELADAYRHGLGTETNMVEAVKWYEKAAKGGADAELLALGAEPEDPEYGDELRQARCNASMRLAEVHALGLLGRVDNQAAVKWYETALDMATAADRKARNGSAAVMNVHSSCVWIGCQMLNEAKEARITPDIAEWLRRCIEPELALYVLRDWAAGFQDGRENCQRNPAKAFVLREFCAQIGDAANQVALGVALWEGNGTSKDQAKAVVWFKKAAQQGNAYGQFDAGLCYEKGEGIPRDYVEAYKWYNLSAAQGHEAARKSRDNLSLWMTPDQIAEAQRRSSAFVARKEKGSSGAKDGDAESGEARFVGTGFIVSADGCIVTCQHVIAEATTIQIRTRNGTWPARLLKADAANDLAVLKVSGQFNALPLAPSRAVKLGDSIFTVGFPNPALQGTSPKLTKGEISSLAGIQDDPRYFQISVPIQPGNSGGALVDATGNVIGLVTSKLSARVALATSGALPENVNYAVKSTYLLGLLESLPEVASKLCEPHGGKTRKWEDVVKDAEAATVMVLVY